MSHNTLLRPWQNCYLRSEPFKSRIELPLLFHRWRTFTDITCSWRIWPLIMESSSWLACCSINAHKVRFFILWCRIVGEINLWIQISSCMSLIKGHFHRKTMLMMRRCLKHSTRILRFLSLFFLLKTADYRWISIFLRFPPVAIGLISVYIKPEVKTWVDFVVRTLVKMTLSVT